MNRKLDKFKELLKDPQALMFEIRKHKKDIAFWLSGILFTLLIFIFVSSKDYSFILVLSSLIQTLAFLIIFLKVYNFQNCSGLSVNTLICYSILLSARLTSTLLFPGYLPSDDSGDWFYQLTEISSLICVLVLIYLCKYVYKETSDYMSDTVHFAYLVIPCLVFALVIHTSLNRFFFTDVMWTFSMYLETFAVYPQLKLFLNKKGQIESYTSHYVSLCGFSRLLSLLFWADTFKELNTSDEGTFSLFSEYSGYFIIISQIGQLVIMVDYYYYYFKSIIKGESLNTLDI